MDDERDSAESAESPQTAESVQGPKGTPPDEGLAYDPAMTEADEGNLPPASDADPNANEDDSG